MSFANVISQTQPAKVKVTEGGEIPAVYVLAESFFVFEYQWEIKEAFILRDTASWTIENQEQNVFSIKCKKYSRTSTIDFDSTLSVMLVLNNADSVELIAPIRAFADVKVVPYTSVVNVDDSIQLLCHEKVGFRADWDYPSYVKKQWRVYGAFDMQVFEGDEYTRGFTGWYDTGDRTKLQDFPMHYDLRNTSFRVKNIKTLHRISINGKIPPLRLSEDYQREWKFNCD